MLKKDFVESRSIFFGLERKMKKEVISGYVKSFDGTDIWFRRTYPAGEPRNYYPLVLCNGMGTTIRYWRYVEDYISNFTDVVVWDYRGHGRSGMPKVPDVSIKTLAEDLKKVCDANDIEAGVFGGFSLGVQVILEFYRGYSNMVKGLIPALGPYENPARYFMNMPITEKLLDLAEKVVYLKPKFFQMIWSNIMVPSFAFKLGKTVGLISEKLFFLNPVLAHIDDFTEYFENLRKMDITLFLRLAIESRKHSAEDILGKIRVPTLIIAGESDIFTPLPVQLKMARKIKGAELIILPKGSHAGLVEHAELVCLRIEKFIKDHAYLKNKRPKKVNRL